MLWDILAILGFLWIVVSRLSWRVHKKRLRRALILECLHLEQWLGVYELCKRHPRLLWDATTLKLLYEMMEENLVERSFFPGTDEPHFRRTRKEIANGGIE